MISSITMQSRALLWTACLKALAAFRWRLYTTVSSPYGPARSSRFPFESRSSGCRGSKWAHMFVKLVRYAASALLFSLDLSIPRSTPPGLWPTPADRNYSSASTGPMERRIVSLHRYLLPSGEAPIRQWDFTMRTQRHELLWKHLRRSGTIPSGQDGLYVSQGSLQCRRHLLAQRPQDRRGLEAVPPHCAAGLGGLGTTQILRAHPSPPAEWKSDQQFLSTQIGWKSALPTKGEVRLHTVIGVASPWRIQKDSLYRRY